MIECPCCDGYGSHETGRCGDGCCVYSEWCDVCHGEGEVTEERLNDVRASDTLTCDFQPDDI